MSGSDVEVTISRTWSAGRRRVLLLGGTTEAGEIAAVLADNAEFEVVSSLAGRVREPRLPKGQVRVGGFGGVAGLRKYLLDEMVDVVLDATHPYAAQMSCNAEAACREARVPLISLVRAPWIRQEGDCWIDVPDAESAAAVVDEEGRRVLLSIGRQELGWFANCRRAWFLVRSIDEPAEAGPPHAEVLLSRGPFTLEEEVKLLRDCAVDLIVSKNSGGAATYPKIEAARMLKIPVVMIARPRKLQVPTVSEVGEVLDALKNCS